MSNQSTKTISTQDGENSRVQKMTEKFETLITSQQQKQQVLTQPLRAVHTSKLRRTGFERGDQRFSTPLPRDSDASRAIKRSQAFRRSISQTGSMNAGNIHTAANQHLIHSDSIREALNKPLPGGPPPVKPPRFRGQERGTLDPDDAEHDAKNYEDVQMLIEVAFQEPEKGQDHDSPTREQISLKQPVSEEHRKRLRRLSRCAELNCYTQQYGTIRVYDVVDKRGSSVATEGNTSDTKGLIELYNKLGTVETTPSAAHTLYTYCIVVGYDITQNKAYVKSKYPRQKVPHKMIEVFVYPDNGALVRDRDQEYCIILTDYPERLYCFCRRVLPESSEFCIPLTYCFVTLHNEPTVFYKLLECIESQHGNGQVPELLMELFYNQKLPLAGEKLSLKLPISFETCSLARRESFVHPAIVISRPKDLRLEKTELYDIYKCLGPDGLIEVFESVLLEKMVILFSEHLSLLSSCIQGLLLMLYPFQWQHILITIIPDHLQQMLEAPVPMLAGTLQPVPEQVWKSGDACYVNLDKRTVRPTKKEQISMLPRELKKPLRVSLEIVKVFEDSRGLASVLIGGAFVRFFVELFSSLDTYAYEKRNFLDKFENPETKLFLNCFLETVMFADFLERWHSSKLVTNPSSSAACTYYTLFNSKIAEKSENKYRYTSTIEEVIANSKMMERKGKTLMAKVKNLIKKS